MMQNYIQQISSLQNPSFQQIQNIAKKNCGSECLGKNRCKPWQVTNHGKDLLDTHERLCKYICAYGEMHEEKMQIASSYIKDIKNFSDQEITVIDWGCGQGLATMCFFDYLKENGIQNNTKKVILIEPSEMALERAKLHVNCYLKDENKIVTVPKYLNAVENAEIQSNTPLTLHFFSNILDIIEIDLMALSQFIADNVNSVHYLFCIGPLYANSNRIDYFYNYFNKPLRIADEKIRQLPRTKNTLRLIIFKLEAGKINLIKVEYYPPVQFHAAYQLDFVRQSLRNISNTDNKNHKLMSAFEVAAPFDIGASVYDDVHPIFAVLNNIITRGLPTRSSPYIEELFETFGNQKTIDDLGNVFFSRNKPLQGDLFSSVDYLTPIAVARVQKTIIEALLTNRIRIDQAEWSVVAYERDVPCSAIAFADLKKMFYHLTALSKDFSALRFPKIRLEIISPAEYSESQLHLGLQATTVPTTAQRLKEYDMVIDVSVQKQADTEIVLFSEFKCKNDCYFIIRSAKDIHSKRHIYTSDIIEYRPLVFKDTKGNYKDITVNKQHLHYFLQLLFRKDDFRPGQLPILNRALQNKSVIGLLPTGGGKSLTYQLAALLQPGITIVVDPLRSLMKDQYDGLLTAGIDTCAIINSTATSKEKEEREMQMETSQLQFVFLSPERLCIYQFRERLRAMREQHVYFSYGVIDEVHCVSEWGHDFRFSYLHLGRNLYNYVWPKNEEMHLTLFGLTATASFDVLADVERELTGNGVFPLDADTIVRFENTNRLELQYKIERVPVLFEPNKDFDKKGLLKGIVQAYKISDKWSVYKSKKEFLKEYIIKIPDITNELQSKESIERIKKAFTVRQNINEDLSKENLNTTFSHEIFQSKDEYTQSGIIFCPHVSNTDISVVEINKALEGIVSKSGTFVGSSNDQDDETDIISFDNLEKFRNDKLPLMVATKAFGMGIDKPNVRFTVNMNYSSSLESFVQEAGRSGRDKKIAIATILFADYKLVRINKSCPVDKFPIKLIKNKWFKEEDLQKLINEFQISVDGSYLDYFTPDTDMVKPRCEVCNTRFAFKLCGEACNKFHDCQNKSKGGACSVKCSYYDSCTLRTVPEEARDFNYIKDLEEILDKTGVAIPKKNLEYINADYENVMYFYNSNFKGSLIEKQTMHEILSNSETVLFLDDDEENKPTQIETVNNFLEKLLSVNVGTEIVSFVNYNNHYSDYAKAIYRMCCIELIDDFTQDYKNNRFRIVTKRKPDGEYYQGLKRFLMRYYSIDRAEEEILKVPGYKGDNEIHKCLGYLTEFIYEKIAVKRKRAIDEMRLFCIEGLNESKDWKLVNEDLKDFIYYYFNSKYAKEDYVTDNGEAFSLTNDTNKGKDPKLETVLKFLRVVDRDLIDAGGTPIDNVKHLQGAVRHIRRSLTGTNEALSLLNAFCLLYLGTNNNDVLEEELWSSYQDGLLGYAEKINDVLEFWRFFEKFHKEMQKRTKASSKKKFENHREEVEAVIHAKFLKQITNKYTTT